MKSFFKKIALVLALAMVVTMMPAKTAAAAEGPQMYKTLKLYIGGDKTETYSDAKYAKVWNKDGYTVAFSSSDENVATVGPKKGLVTAVGVGTATITATFTSEDGDVVSKECVVTVKKNAVDAGISENSAAKLAEGIAVGESFQTKVFRTDADGVTTWKGKDVITDGARFASTNTEIFTVTKTTGKVTGVKAGEAMLQVWAVQSEGATKDENGKIVEYLTTTAVREYPVKIVEGTIEEVKQTSVTTFELTCTDETAAAKITADNISVAYVANGLDVQTFIKSVAVKDADKKVVVVTLHNPISAGVTYKVTSGETTLEFVGAALTPASIAITTAAVEAGNEPQNVNVAVYNADGVDITAAVDVTNNVTISAPESTDYYVDGAARQIYFFNANKTANVTATYDMGYDEQGNELVDLTTTATITSYAISTTNGNISGWLVTKDATKATNASNFNNNAVTLAAGDDGFVIYGVYTKTTGSNNETKFTANAVADGVVFTYGSTNESVLLVDPNTGALYPVAAGAAAVIVKSGDIVVGVCNINVVASRNFATFTATADKTKLSQGVDDKITVTLSVKDQLGSDIAANITAEQVQTSNKEIYVTAALNTDGKIEIVADGATTDTPKTVYVKITATVGSVTKTQTVPVSVKRVDPTATPASYSVNVTKTSIDTKLESWKSVADYTSTISVNYYDAAGYYLGTKTAADLTQIADVSAAATGNGEYSYIVTKDGKAFSLTDASLVAIVASGGSEVTKLATGSYIVRVYRGNGTRAQLIGSNAINVSDSTVAMTVVQDKQDAEHIFESLTFKRGTAVVDKNTLAYVDMDATVTASGTFVRTIKITETVGSYTWTFDVPVYKLFK